MATATAAFATIDFRVAPNRRTAYVGMGGDVDMASGPGLAETAAELSRLAPENVFIDLDAVSFADATLLNFVVRLIHYLPAGSPLVLCRPTATTRYLLQITRIDMLATLRDDLPPSWPLRLEQPAPVPVPTRSRPWSRRLLSGRR